MKNVSSSTLTIVSNTPLTPNKRETLGTLDFASNNKRKHFWKRRISFTRRYARFLAFENSKAREQVGEEHSTR